MPLFVGMRERSKKIVKESVAYVNPSQTHVIIMDLPLFPNLAAKVDLYGEEKYVMVMGGVHVKMALLKMVEH